MNFSSFVEAPSVNDIHANMFLEQGDELVFHAWVHSLNISRPINVGNFYSPHH